MQWDERLTPLGVNLQTTKDAKWSALAAQYEDETQAQGQHNIWFTVVDEHNHPISGAHAIVDWVGRDKDDPATMVLTDANGKANVPIYANLDITKKNGPYFAYIDGKDKSDIIAGMGLPEHHHVNFDLTYGMATQPTPDPEPAPPPPTPTPPTPTPPTPPPPTNVPDAILAKAKTVPWMAVNNGAALWNFAKASGLQDQQTDEMSVTINGQEYVLQVFNLGIVYAKQGDWGNIQVIRK